MCVESREKTVCCRECRVDCMASWMGRIDVLDKSVDRSSSEQLLALRRAFWRKESSATPSEEGEMEVKREKFVACIELGPGASR